MGAHERDVNAKRAVDAGAIEADVATVRYGCPHRIGRVAIDAHRIAGVGLSRRRTGKYCTPGISHHGKAYHPMARHNAPAKRNETTWQTTWGLSVRGESRACFMCQTETGGEFGIDGDDGESLVAGSAVLWSLLLGDGPSSATTGAPHPRRAAPGDAVLAAGAPSSPAAS